MKKDLAVLLLVMGLAIGVQAQKIPQTVIYLGGGTSPLSGDFAKSHNQGYHGLCGLGTKVTDKVDVVAKVEYHSFSCKLPGLPYEGGTLSSLMIGADVRYEIGPRLSVIKPVILTGIGVTKVAVSDLTDGYMTVRFKDEKRFYFEAGGGFAVRLGRLTRLFVTARFVLVTVTGADLNYTPITVGIVL